MRIHVNATPWTKRNAIDTTRPPPLDTRVGRHFATQYLAERMPRPYDDIRKRRDRVGKQIDTACGNGKLKSVNGTYLFGDLVAWARPRGRLAASVADIALPTTGSAHIVSPAMSISASGFSIPASLPDCQAALTNAYRELNVLHEENNALRATVAILTPYQERALARSVAASRAGKEGGRGIKK